MPFPFDVGDPILQDLLDWVALPAQPPPPQGRDTHALRFILRKNQTGLYSGLMFFRPPQAGEGGGVASLPGLNGTGSLIANVPVCQDIVSPSQGDPAFHAKVNIMIRRQPTAPAQMFATITFFNRILPDSPHPDAEAVDTSNVSISQFDGNIDINPPVWELQLQKTTVLLRSP